MRILPKKEFKEKYPRDYRLQGITEWNEDAGEWEVVVPEGSSTKTRVHELRHLEQSRQSKKGTVAATPEEYAANEVDAIVFTKETIGGEPTWAEYDEAIYTLLKRYKQKPNKVFNLLMKQFEEQGFEIDQEERSYLWNRIREMAKE